MAGGPDAGSVLEFVVEDLEESRVGDGDGDLVAADAVGVPEGDAEPLAALDAGVLRVSSMRAGWWLMASSPPKGLALTSGSKTGLKSFTFFVNGLAIFAGNGEGDQGAADDEQEAGRLDLELADHVRGRGEVEGDLVGLEGVEGDLDEIAFAIFGDGGEHAAVGAAFGLDLNIVFEVGGLLFGVEADAIVVKGFDVERADEMAVCIL